MSSSKHESSRALRELADLKKEYQDFAYVVTHDLSTVLRHIEAFSALILEDNATKFDDEARKYFGYVISGAENGKRLLDALLEYSRLQTRAEPFAPVACNELVADALESLDDLIDSTGARFDIPELPTITADGKQIGQVFHHLLQNALVFQIEGARPQVTISAHETDSGWTFSVRDNGIGISPNRTDEIFKILRRAVGDQYPGLGMGLAAVKKIVRRHHGEVSVESELNVGSTFTFSIQPPEI